VKNELDKLPAPPTKPSPSAPARPSPARPAATLTPQQARTDRLRAALATPETKFTAPTTKTPAPAPAPEAASESEAKVPAAVAPSLLPPTELMKAVSTRWLNPAGGGGGGGGASSFAKMKEHRQSRQTSFPGIRQMQISTAVSPAPTAAAPSRSSTAPTRPSESASIACSAPHFELPVGGLDQLSIAERELVASPAWQSIASNTSSIAPKTPATRSIDPRQIETLPSARASAATTSAGVTNTPTTPAGFEQHWMAAKSELTGRLDLLRVG